MMYRKGCWKHLFLIVGLAVLVPAMGSVATAAENREILQAVKNGVPNTADNRVVLAELFSAED
jgi:hypothetical protein